MFMKKTLWILFVTISILTGLYPAIYFMIDRKFGLLGTKTTFLLNDIVWNSCFYTHIILGGIALLIGWIQFNKKFRINNIATHKKIGKIYMICVALSAIAGMYIAFYATGGWVTSLAFITLDIVWVYSTISAFIQIKKGDVKKHENYMIYSYAATFAAVTLRIWLPIMTLTFESFSIGYPIAAWMSFLPNLIVAYFIVNKKNYTI